MKKVLLTLVLIASFEAQAANVKTIDLTKRMRDHVISMSNIEGISILVENEGAKPQVTFDPKNDENALCEGVEIKVKKQGSNYLIGLTPSFLMDDGNNDCEVQIDQPSGKSATITMSVDLS